MATIHYKTNPAIYTKLVAEIPDASGNFIQEEAGTNGVIRCQYKNKALILAEPEETHAKITITSRGNDDKIIEEAKSALEELTSFTLRKTR